MNKFSLLVLVTSLLISFSNTAQQYSENNSQNDLRNSQDLQNYTTRTTNFEPTFDTKGTPFYNDKFILGSLLNENKVLVSNIALRYNAFRDQFEVKQSLNQSNENIQAVIKRTDILVKMGDDVFTYIVTPEGTTKGYFDILFEGKKFSVFKKISKKFIEGITPVNTMKSTSPNRYVDEVDYFLVGENNDFKELSNSKNKRLKAIGGDKRKELKKYAKENNLNVKEEADLIKVVEYYNENF